MERTASSRLVNFLYRLLYAGTFSVVILFCISDLTGISDVNWKHMAVRSATAVLLSAVCLLSGRQRLYAAVLGVCAFLFLFLSIGGERCLLYFGKVLDLPTVQQLPLADYEILAEEQIYIELGRVFLLTVGCCLIQTLSEKNIYLKIVSADIAGGWMLYMQNVPKTGVVFFILYTGLVATEWIRAHWKKMKNENARAYILSVLPFLAAYAVFLCFMPMQEKPYDWQWAKNIYRSAEEKVTMYAENFGNIGNEYFNGTTSGFSENGGFFDDIRQNNRQLMTLGLGNHKDVAVYLTGKVFDSFNGREWESLRSGSQHDLGESERMLDTLETVYALARYTDSLNPVYYQNIRMDVSYQYFHTDYLLAPTKTWSIEDAGKKIKYHHDGSDFVFNRKAGYGTEYVLRFCQPDMEREELYRFLEWEQGEDVKEWSRTVRQYSEGSVSIEELCAYREMIKEEYLPRTDIGPEAEQWLTFVTADAKTDVEKLKMIESALSDMAYNTSPGKLPETVTDERSFLDYFLSEKREGYCAYFATAFALLARAEGFPARYVQGFCVPAVSGDETPVYSDMAHAWPEVYIEGKGWIAFEPTPGFGVNRYIVREESKGSDAQPSYTGNPGYREQEDIPVSEGAIPDGNIQTGQSSQRFLPYLLRVVLILLIGSVLAIVIDRLWEAYREKRRKLSEKYRLAVLHNLQILDMLGYKREPSETYHELAERIGQEISCGFIDVYERYLYGSLDIDERILDEVLAERTQLFAQLKKRRRKTYLLCRIRLYIVRFR